MNSKIFIIGYYGFHNLGDELLLKETINIFEKFVPKKNIKVLSYQINETKIAHGIEGISRNKFFKILKEIYLSDMIVGGGGSMLQNITSNRSLFYYLAIINIALIMNKKVILLGNGIGPISGKFQNKIVENTLNRLDYLHLRDKESYNSINGESKKHIDLGSDLAFNTKFNKIASKRNRVVINLRSCENIIKVQEVIKQFIEYLEDKGFETLLLSMQRGKDDQVLKVIGNTYNYDSVDDITNEIASSRVIIGMRLHSLIISAALNIPFIGLSYDPKVRAFCNEMEVPYFDNLEEINISDLINKFEYLLVNEIELVSYLEKKTEILKHKNDIIFDKISQLMKY